MSRNLILVQLGIEMPALLHELVKKCNKEDHVIPAEYSAMLNVLGLTRDGVPIESVKRIVLEEVILSDEGEISMRL